MCDSPTFRTLFDQNHDTNYQQLLGQTTTSIMVLDHSYRSLDKLFQDTLNYQITVPVLLIFPGQNTLWYSNFFVVLLFIPMKMLLRYFYLLWYFY